MKKHGRNTKPRWRNGLSRSHLLGSWNGKCRNLSIRLEASKNCNTLGCSRNMEILCFRSFLSSCIINMECALPFWLDIVIQKESPQSHCKYWVLSSYHLTIYHIVMISIMSWKEHHSKPVTETGQRNRWLTTSRNGLLSLLVNGDSLRERH
jgi:hypothetical protein